MELRTEVAVIGAGHAGIEAALAAARMGKDTVLFTTNLDAVGNMPCNPSIGGTGKGHLVYEIDALGGEMGRAADAVTMQSRTLNTGKGAAVRSKRVQADRTRYREYMKAVIEKERNLRLIQAEITDIGIEEKEGKKRIVSVTTRLGERWQVDAAILACGTFLGGRIFVGDTSYSSGPDSLMPADMLTEALLREGVSLRRFKTGTPVRVNRRSIDFSRLEKQEGEISALPFSQDSSDGYLDNIDDEPCYIVYTNKNTHKVILDNIKRSAMYSGQIHGVGPRYCPSIEDKLVRFADKERHQLFVEPVSRGSNEMYIQGFSTSLPTDVQREMLATLDGFENAEIMRYAYAIEYDCVDPLTLYPTLEFKDIENLYGAGQFNGTSGYEEAAAQGLVAGVNAVLKLRGDAPMVLTRDSSYIGTLIDDLVTKGTNEPYRIMTSRSEYRLLLRQDNADIRLSPIGHRVGLLSEEKYNKFLLRVEKTEKEIARLKKATLSPDEKTNSYLEKRGSTPLSTGIHISDLLRRPEIDYPSLAELDTERPELSKRIAESVEVTVKYEGYIEKQEKEAQKSKKMEEKLLPEDIDYKKIGGLRLEAAQKLDKIRPKSVGQAARISGVNPADITVLLIYLAKKN